MTNSFIEAMRDQAAREIKTIKQGEKNNGATRNYDAIQRRMASRASKKFGDEMEICLKKILGLSWSDTTKYDLFDENNGYKIEVKASRLISKEESQLTIDEKIEEVGETQLAHFDALFDHQQKNYFYFGQVKPKFFDYVIYLTITQDIVTAYMVSSHEVQNGVGGYNDKQHANSHDEGQIQLTAQQLEWYDERILFDMKFEEFVEIYRNALVEMEAEEKEKKVARRNAKLTTKAESYFNLMQSWRSRHTKLFA